MESPSKLNRQNTVKLGFLNRQNKNKKDLKVKEKKQKKNKSFDNTIKH